MSENSNQSQLLAKLLQYTVLRMAYLANQMGLLEANAGIDGVEKRVLSPDELELIKTSNIGGKYWMDIVAEALEKEGRPLSPEFLAANTFQSYIVGSQEHAINTAKLMRKDADELLQWMKGHMKELKASDFQCLDKGEVMANHQISIRALEDSIMRLGMALKYIGNTPDPYQNSNNVNSLKIDPTADNLKM